ncbi:MAG: SUMF1/EgtB/PvdO family nonheme iron enzyme [Kiritimatiellae bacterium]|nr:SUMF1/EgtB/PvdO family nonheme iron enzyme [Kiritimatiellia bacterium]
MRLIPIPLGTSLFGGLGRDIHFDEVPPQTIRVSHSFRVSETEVTNEQFEKFRPEHRSLRGKNGFSKENDEAVIYVSWHDAVAFCAWLSQREGRTYRLPTEEEWEYACRAGSVTDFAIDRNALKKNQKLEWTPVSVSLRVKETPPNAWGLYDMHGNVEEWCADWYGAYPVPIPERYDGPETGYARIVRGGSHNTQLEFLRSSNRSALLPEDKTLFTGFRIVEDLSGHPLAASVPQTPGTDTQSLSPPPTSSAIPLPSASEAPPTFAEPIPFVRLDNQRATPFFYRHNHCPALTWLPNGDLLAIWFSCEKETGREMVILSSRLARSQGATEWSTPELFFQVADRNLTGSSLFYDEQENKLWHLNGMEAAGSWQNLALIGRFSLDSGRTWSAPRILDAEHAMGNQVIASMFKLRNGTLVQACDATPAGNGGSILHLSKDRGKSWFRAAGKIAGIHAGVVELKNGDLLAFGRGDDVTKGEKAWMPMSLSKDCGASWTVSASPFPTISSCQRLQIRRLREGPILFLSFTDNGKGKGLEFVSLRGKKITGHGLFAALSFDEGRTWPVARLLTDGKERYLLGGANSTGFFRMDAEHAEPRGYLALTQSPDNWIHLVSSGIYYRFNLAWLLDEGWSSPSFPTSLNLPCKDLSNQLKQAVRIPAGTSKMNLAPRLLWERESPNTVYLGAIADDTTTVAAGQKTMYSTMTRLSLPNWEVAGRYVVGNSRMETGAFVFPEGCVAGNIPVNRHESIRNIFHINHAFHYREWDKASQRFAPEVTPIDLLDSTNRYPLSTLGVTRLLSRRKQKATFSNLWFSFEPVRHQGKLWGYICGNPGDTFDGCLVSSGNDGAAWRVESIPSFGCGSAYAGRVMQRGGRFYLALRTTKGIRLASYDPVFKTWRNGILVEGSCASPALFPYQGRIYVVCNIQDRRHLKFFEFVSETDIRPAYELTSHEELRSFTFTPIGEDLYFAYSIQKQQATGKAATEICILRLDLTR